MEFVVYNAGGGGLGSHLSSKLLGLGFSYNYPEYKYIHYKWNNTDNIIGCNYENDIEFEDKLEKYFNLSKFSNIKIIESVKENTSNCVVDIRDLDIFSNIFKNSDQELINKCYTKEFLDYYRKIFYSDKKRFITSKDKTIITVHLRRGEICKLGKISAHDGWVWTPSRGFYKIETNVTMKEKSNYGLPGTDNAVRWLDDNYYINTMKKLESMYSNIEFRLVSQGKKEDFEDIINKFSNITLYLNTDIIDTFNLLINNDILIMGRSALSYCAGLISENTVICNSHHNYNCDKIPSELKNWIII